MARGKKPPSARGHRYPTSSKKTIHRWAERKIQETGDRNEARIDMIAELGSRQKCVSQFGHLAKLKREAAKKEREMLAKTSLKDLIK
jgi:hypothetical protein